MTGTRFTVDTHLFRELGELLVGRDSTALVELIKNSYDADATEVTVHGEELDRQDRGRIVVTDDGMGMTYRQFQDGFLRVASRLKEEGERRSTLFGRRFTGSKGIGRLAAHKLARRLEIESVALGAEDDLEREALHAVIDWDRIEQYETLDQIDATDAIVVETTKARRQARSGTTLILSGLRRGWTPTERARFFAEVLSFDSPAFLQNPLPQSVLPQPPGFDMPAVRDSKESGAPFTVRLEGDFAAGEDYWELVAEIASWVLEIRADPRQGNVRVAVAPTVRTRRENPGGPHLHDIDTSP